MFGCFIIIVLGVKVFGRYLFEDPCDGDGNFREPTDYYDYEIEEKDERTDKSFDTIIDEINKLKELLKKKE